MKSCILSTMNAFSFLQMCIRDREKTGVVGTPGAGFGAQGEGYFRLTAFGDREKTKEALSRIAKAF